MLISFVESHCSLFIIDMESRLSRRRCYLNCCISPAFSRFSSHLISTHLLHPMEQTFQLLTKKSRFSRMERIQSLALRIQMRKFQI